LCIIQIKLNQFVYDRQLINKAYLEDITATNIITVLPTNGGENQPE